MKSSNKNIILYLSLETNKFSRALSDHAFCFLLASNTTIYDSCFHHGCQNDGVCVLNDTSGYTCNCTEGYGGFFCEVELGIVAVWGLYSERVPLFMFNLWIY